MAVVWEAYLGEVLSVPVANFALPCLSQAVPAYGPTCFQYLENTFIAKIPWPASLDVTTWLMFCTAAHHSDFSFVAPILRSYHCPGQRLLGKPPTAVA